MGYTPIPRVMPQATKLETVKRAYVLGWIGLEEFEERVEDMLLDGTDNDPPAVLPPEKPSQ